MSLTPTTWNPADKGSGATLSNGNLTVNGNENSGWARSVFGASSGKWYWEITTTGSPRAPVPGIGTSAATADVPGTDANGYGFYWINALKIRNNVYTAYGSALGTGDVLGIALDLDGGSLTFYKNGVSMGVAFTGIPAGTYYAMTAGDTNGTTSNTVANFGATAFAYTVPTGYQAGFGPNLTWTLSGTVADSGAVVRTVRIYRRDTGAFVGSTVSDGSGNWSYTVTDSAMQSTSFEFDIICLDDVSGTVQNDLIARDFPVGV